MQAGFADVRPAVGVRLRLVLEHLVLPLADDLEALPLWTQRSILVEVDGNARLIVIALAEAVRELYALFHRDALYRRERDDVDCADARVAALVRVHVYVLERDLSGFEKGLLNRSRSPDEADYEAVVVFVGPRLPLKQFTISSMTSCLRPSLKLGTHSISCTAILAITPFAVFIKYRPYSIVFL